MEMYHLILVVFAPFLTTRATDIDISWIPSPSNINTDVEKNCSINCRLKYSQTLCNPHHSSPQQCRCSITDGIGNVLPHFKQCLKEHKSPWLYELNRRKYLIDHNCGFSIEELERPRFKMCSGNDAVRLQFPWTVKVREERASQTFSSTGVLIGPKTILTASHAIENKDSSNFAKINIYGGDTDWTDNKGNGWKANPVKITADGRTDDNTYVDLAIIELDKEIKNTAPICLLRPNDDPPYSSYDSDNVLRFSGYGGTDDLYWGDFGMEDSSVSYDYQGTSVSCNPTGNYICSKPVRAYGLRKGDSGGAWAYRKKVPFTNRWQWYVMSVFIYGNTRYCHSSRGLFVNLKTVRSWICENTSGIC